MIEESTLTDDNIKEELLCRYNMRVNNVEVINNGSASIYKVHSDNGIYLLKEFQSKYSKDDVLREIKAIEFLKQKSQIPVPVYLQCTNGDYYFIHNGRVVVVQNFINGRVFNKNEGNHKELLESAHYLGKIVNCFEEFKVDKSINILDWCSKEEFKKAINKYEVIKRKSNNSKIELKIKEDMNFKEELLYEIEQTIDFNEIAKVTHKTSHGDYSSLQIIYDNYNKI